MEKVLLTATLPCYCCRESGCDDGCMCTGIDQEAPLVVYDGVSVKPLVENARGMLAALEEIMDSGCDCDGCIMAGNVVAKVKGG